MKRLMCSSILLTVLTVMLTINLPSEAIAKAIKWRMGSCWSTGNALIDPDRHFVEIVNEMAGDDLKIKFHPVGEIVSAFELLGAVEEGTLQAGGDWAGYWTGKNTAFNVLAGFPMAPRNVDYAAWIYKSDGFDMYNEIYGKYGVVYLPHAVLSAESGIRGNKKYNELGDFKGSKVRISGKLQSKLLSDLGGVPVSMAGEEIYQGLERGLIDAAEYSLPNIDWSMGLQHVTKEWNVPGWYQSGAVLGVMINKKSWDALPKKTQAILKHAAEATMLWSLGHYNIESGRATKKFLDSGAQINTLSDASVDKIEVMAYENMLEEAKRNPLFAKAIYSIFGTIGEIAPYRNLIEGPAVNRKIVMPDMDLVKKYAEEKTSK